MKREANMPWYRPLQNRIWNHTSRWGIWVGLKLSLEEYRKTPEFISASEAGEPAPPIKPFANREYHQQEKARAEKFERALQSIYLTVEEDDLLPGHVVNAIKGRVEFDPRSAMEYDLERRFTWGLSSLVSKIGNLVIKDRKWFYLACINASNLIVDGHSKFSVVMDLAEQIEHIEKSEIVYTAKKVIEAADTIKTHHDGPEQDLHFKRLVFDFIERGIRQYDVTEIKPQLDELRETMEAIAGLPMTKLINYMEQRSIARGLVE